MIVRPGGLDVSFPIQSSTRCEPYAAVSIAAAGIGYGYSAPHDKPRRDANDEDSAKAVRVGPMQADQQVEVGCDGQWPPRRPVALAITVGDGRQSPR